MAPIALMSGSAAESPTSTVASNDHSISTIILFGGTPDSPDEYIIPAKHVAQLPTSVKDRLANEGDTLEGKGMKIVTIGSSKWLESLRRLREFLDHRDFAPFNPRTPLKVIDDANTEREWRNDMNMDKIDKCNESTHGFFTQEMRMYAFATTFEYPELRQFVSSKIRNDYPVLARETLAMMDQLFPMAVRNKDTALIKYIRDSAVRNSDRLVIHSKYTELFREKITQVQDPITRILLDIQLAATSKTTADRFLAEQSQVMHPIEAPTGPKGRDPITKLERNNHTASVLSTLHELLMDERLVIARQDGYGTLLPLNGNYTRNKDFIFQKFELLVADFSRKAFNGKHNVTVVNSRGERGDLLGSLVESVPPSLGAGLEPLNLGKRGREPSPPRRMSKHVKLEEHTPPGLEERINRDHPFFR